MTVDITHMIKEESVQYSRPYKSRRQRPCDFCRKRKSCCIIEGTAPCKLCRTFKKECTFIEGPISRPKPKFDENGQRIITRKRSPSSTKKDISDQEPKPKRKRGRKPKSPMDTTYSISTNAIDPSLMKQQQPLAAVRRFSAPVPPVKREFNNKAVDLDFVNEQHNIITSNNELLLENLHYSLEDHDANTGLSAVTNNETWKNIFGYLVDSPLLQPQRLEDISKSPLIHSSIPESSPYNEVFMSSNSSSTSHVSNIRPTESLTSFDSPGSSLSGGSVHHEDFYPTTFAKTKTSPSGFQFLQSDHDNSYIDPFIFSVLGNGKEKSDNVDKFKLGNYEYNNNNYNNRAGEQNDSKRVTTKYLNYQRDIFAVLDNYGDKLINLYLTYVDPFLPILSKTQINFIFSNGDFTKASIICSLKKINLALVASIISSSLEYWDLDNELILDETPSVEKMNEMAFDLIFSEFELRGYSNSQSRFDLLQSCLIICIKCSFDVTNLDQLYKIDIMAKLISISHTLIQELGLNIDFTNYSSLDGEDQSDDQIFKNNLWWCFYVQEKWFSLLTGKQSSIHEENFDLKIHIQTPSDIVSILAPYKKEDGVDVSNYRTLHKNCSKYFEEMIKLTLILSEIMKNFYKMNEDEDDQGFTNEQHFKQLFKTDDFANVLNEKLLIWKDNLPEFFEFFESDSSSRRSKIGGYINANASLQISYYVTSLSLHKVMLKKFSNKYMKLSSLSDMNNSLLINDLKTFETRFNNLKLNAIKVSIDCSRAIKSLKLQHLNGFWYAFINFKFIFITNFFIVLHMVVDKTSNDLNPPLPISTTDLAQSANYNNNLQFKSTMQKILTDFKSCIKNRSSKWKFARLANDLFQKFKSFEDIDILENYGKSNSWKRSPLSNNGSSVHNDANNLQTLNGEEEFEPLSLDEEAPKFELLSYDEKYIIV